MHGYNNCEISIDICDSLGLLNLENINESEEAGSVSSNFSSEKSPEFKIVEDI